MRKRWVCNASPLILLAKVGRVTLLPTLADALVIPEAVAHEVGAGPPDDPARRWIEDRGRAYVQPVGDPADPEVAAWDLGHGESAVLTWARAQDEAWTVLLDDGAARRAARAFSLSLSGTLGVLLAAKEAGRVAEVQPVVEELVRADLHLNDAVLSQTLRQAGESP